MTPRPTILVLRALGLGDFVTGVPALSMLRAVRPDHRIVLAMPKRWQALLERIEVVDEVVDAHELAALRGAPHRPELAIDLHGSGPASRQLLEPSRPHRVLAYADGAVRWRPEEHEVPRWCRLLREGLPAADAACVELPGILGDPPPGDASLTGRTVVHVGAAAASRRWPPTRFAATALTLAAEGHDVVITGGPGEHDLAGQVARAAGVPAATGLDITQLAHLVGHAQLVVSGDTGVAHLAAAYRRPSVTLFGPVSPARWGPPQHQRHQVLWFGDDTGDPHGAALDPALARIGVADAVAAAHTALPALPAHAR